MINYDIDHIHAWSIRFLRVRRTPITNIQWIINFSRTEKVSIL